MLEVLRHLGLTVANAAALCRSLIASPPWPPPLISLLNACFADEETTLYFRSSFRYWLDKIRDISKRLKIDCSEDLAQYDAFLTELDAAFKETTSSNSFSPTDPLGSEEIRRVEHIDEVANIKGRAFYVTENNRICSGINQVEKGDIVVTF